MKAPFPFQLAIFFPIFLISISGTAAPKKIAIIGDSLSREYQFEFFEFPEARNWVEILAARRPNDFNFGTLETLDTDLLDFFCRIDQFDKDICAAISKQKGLRYYGMNLAVPGFTTADYRDYLTPQGFEPTKFLFRNVWVKPEIENADVVVIFLGGNDIDRVYHSSVSEIGKKGDRIYANLSWLIQEVREWKKNVPIVLANVPHVGATPNLKLDAKTKPTNTTRITNELNDLDRRIRALAAERGNVAVADVYQLTLDTLPDVPYFIGHTRFENASTDGVPAQDRPRYLWLGGNLSDNFHPNTVGQAVLANAIISAINTFPKFNVAPLSNREIVQDIAGLPFEPGFEDWAAQFGIKDLTGQSDGDKDNLKDLIEFVFGGNPKRPNGSLLPVPEFKNGQISLTFTPAVRLDGPITVIPQTSPDLKTWTDAPQLLHNNGDGSFTAATDFPFLRLKVMKD